MRVQTCSRTLYTYDELSAAAQDTARNWYRELIETDEYADATYDDAERIAEIFGITFKDRPYQTIGGKTMHKPAIMFSGFWSQGDGACFEGTYAYAKGAPKKIRAYAPKDEALHKIADSLQALQKKHFYRVTATVRHSGHYYHEYCTTIETSAENPRTGTDPGLPADDDKALAELLRAFMRWIYAALETEYDYQTSDATIAENIRANEYEFDEDGKRA